MQFSQRGPVALPLLLGSRSFCFRKRSAKSPLSRNRPKSPKSTRYSPCGVFCAFVQFVPPPICGGSAAEIGGSAAEIGGNAAEIPREKWSLTVVFAGLRGINWQHEWQRLKRSSSNRLVLAPTCFDDLWRIVRNMELYKEAACAQHVCLLGHTRQLGIMLMQPARNSGSSVAAFLF